jgi:hypothetical protein
MRRRRLNAAASRYYRSRFVSKASHHAFINSNGTVAQNKNAIGASCEWLRKENALAQRRFRHLAGAPGRGCRSQASAGKAGDEVRRDRSD